MEDDAIIRVPFAAARASLIHAEDLDRFHAACRADDDDERQRRLFTIRAADSAGRRSSASILINRMYATRGYLSCFLPAEQTDERITLVASEQDETIGTMTIGFDSRQGLLADQLFGREIAAMRDAGRSVCEFTKLAVDASVSSRRVLASLFHVAFIHAHRLGGTDNVLIEVNPRHVRYYQRMLGFTVAGPERLNPRVNAPAVLLNLDLAHADRQIARFGGQPEYGETERSLYPYFFSAHEQAGIVRRLRRQQAAEAGLTASSAWYPPLHAAA